MKTADFTYDLPDKLIAQYPLDKRSDSRLLVLPPNTDGVEHRQFSDIVDYLQPGDCLVLNNSRVIPARLYATKPTGGKVELLIERIQDDQHCLAHIKASKAPKPGTILCFQNGIEATVVERQDALFALAFSENHSIWDLMAAEGHMPLPPYMHRDDEQADWSRYQTVYAKPEGSVAAPTAGLHFDEALLKAIAAKGVDIQWVTLHVGAGTFQPVRVDNVENHVMHSEWVEVNETVCQAVKKAKNSGHAVIAVGTTSVRCLETAAKGGELKPYRGETDIFIYPGYEFQVIDKLITNFHLPESTLLMLVSALVGKERILSAYQTAVNEQYRFFSYGDAMLLTCQ